MLNFTYILLALTVIFIFLVKDKKIIKLFLIGTNLAALFEGVINPIALCYLLIFSSTVYVYYNIKIQNYFLRIILFVLICLFIIGFGFHLIGGFNNVLAVDNIQLSSISLPCRMRLNFDKTMMALIIYVLSNLHDSEKTLNKHNVISTLRIFALAISVIIFMAYTMSYIKYDPKLPDITALWIMNNLLFVAMSEEVIFRGFIQKTLSSFFTRTKVNLPYIHILIASLLFGLAHYHGGGLYIILAFIAGIFYGYAYEKTKSLLCSILVHFGLNFVHFILFTYPAAIS